MNYSVGGTWTAMSVLTAIPIGAPVSIRNIGRAGDIIEIIISATEPLESDRGEAITQLGNTYRITNHPNEVWIRYISYSDSSTIVTTSKTCLVTIQQSSYISDSDGLPADLFTSDELGTRRLAVDSQQTSYEENAQFRYFDRISAVPNGSQIVYKFTTANPLNVLQRYFELSSGGRQLLVYPHTENIVFTGTLVDSGRITPINSNLSPNNATHPVTGFTAQRAVGSGIFSTTDLPIDGVSVVSDSQGNASSSSFSADGLRTGVPSGTVSYFVLNSIANNDAASGALRFVYEELF